MEDVLYNIISKTIGFDLTEVKPLPKEEMDKWLVEQERKRKEWEANHPEEIEREKQWRIKIESKKPYVLSEEERKTVKELLKIDDEQLDTMEISIFNDGNISVRTPEYTWLCLAGRDWEINIKNKTATKIAMS